MTPHCLEVTGQAQSPSCQPLRSPLCGLRGPLGLPLDPGTQQLSGKEMTLEPLGSFGRSSCRDVWPPAVVFLPPRMGMNGSLCGRSQRGTGWHRHDACLSHVLTRTCSSPVCCPLTRPAQGSLQTPSHGLAETCCFARRPKPRDVEIPPADNLAELGFLFRALRLQKPKFLL